MKEIDCTRADEADLVALYLAGKLPESEAEGFEAHYLGCDRCAAPAEARSPGHDVWTLLAAAATAAMFFYGMGHLARNQAMVTDPAALRSGGTDAVALTITAGADGQVVLEWPAHPEAQSYRIEILRSDGLPVLESETADRRVALAVGDLPPRPDGVRLLARIEALDAMRQVVAKSGAEPLPGS